MDLPAGKYASIKFSSNSEFWISHVSKVIEVEISPVNSKKVSTVPFIKLRSKFWKIRFDDVPANSKNFPLFIEIPSRLTTLIVILFVTLPINLNRVAFKIFVYSLTSTYWISRDWVMESNSISRKALSNTEFLIIHVLIKRVVDDDAGLTYTKVW